MENRLEEMRQARNLTREDLARALGVTRETIIAIEENRYNPSLELAIHLARVLGTSVEDLFAPRPEDTDQPESALQ
ncbi:MAG: helix-turn-helix transcriptional regulator [Methanomicrobiaceae archaeon]|nr:helix-turn-helix transcriptional regulator [Methanomicrobiaceae archaeon]